MFVPPAETSKERSTKNSRLWLKRRNAFLGGHRNQLIQKNTQLEDYFDPYVSEDGTWDYDKLNSHRAVVDNIDKIVANAYRQGISDGQRNVVTKVANSSVESPQTNPNQNPADPINDQLKGLVGNMGRGLSFNPRI